MADNGIQQETIQCSRCKKRFFEDGFRVNRLGRRNKTCLECNAKKKAQLERAKQDPEKVAKMKATDNARWERIKEDHELLAARRLQQVLGSYMQEFPDDPHPPTTQGEVDAKREHHRIVALVKGGISRGTLQRRLDRLDCSSHPPSKELAAKIREVLLELGLSPVAAENSPALTDAELAGALAELGF